MALRAVICPHCRQSLDEADSRWEVALRSGDCPACGRMYDVSVEAQAEAGARDPSVRKRARQVRLIALLLAAFSLPVGAMMLYIGVKGGVYVAAFGAAQLLVAVFYTAKAEARSSLKGFTDLYRMSSRR